MEVLLGSPVAHSQLPQILDVWLSTACILEQPHEILTVYGQVRCACVCCVQAASAGGAACKQAHVISSCPGLVESIGSSTLEAQLVAGWIAVRRQGMQNLLWSTAVHKLGTPSTDTSVHEGTEDTSCHMKHPRIRSCGGLSICDGL